MERILIIIGICLLLVGMSTGMNTFEYTTEQKQILNNEIITSSRGLSDDHISALHKQGAHPINPTDGF